MIRAIKRLSWLERVEENLTASGSERTGEAAMTMNAHRTTAEATCEMLVSSLPACAGSCAEEIGQALNPNGPTALLYFADCTATRELALADLVGAYVLLDEEPTAVPDGRAEFVGCYGTFDAAIDA